MWGIIDVKEVELIISKKISNRKLYNTANITDIEFFKILI